MKKLLFAFAVQILTFGMSHAVNAVENLEPFDLRVQGRGYLGVELPDGSIAYTKSSLVAPNEYGALTTEDDYYLYPSVTANTVATARRIGTDGTVSALIPPSQTWAAEGQLMVYSFEDASKLKPIGAGLYKATSGSGPATSGTAGSNGFGQIKVSE